MFAKKVWSTFTSWIFFCQKLGRLFTTFFPAAARSKEKVGFAPLSSSSESLKLSLILLALPVFTSSLMVSILPNAPTLMTLLRTSVFSLPLLGLTGAFFLGFFSLPNESLSLASSSSELLTLSSSDFSDSSWAVKIVSLTTPLTISVTSEKLAPC